MHRDTRDAYERIRTLRGEPYLCPVTSYHLSINFGFMMSESKICSSYPSLLARLPLGTVVVTTQSAGADDWTREAVASRKWGVEGTVVGEHDEVDVYDVRHHDGTLGHYEPRELRVATREDQIDFLVRRLEEDPEIGWQAIQRCKVVGPWATNVEEIGFYLRWAVRVTPESRDCPYWTPVEIVLCTDGSCQYTIYSLDEVSKIAYRGETASLGEAKIECDRLASTVGWVPVGPAR
jgi:hypothetical protein